MRMRLGFSTVVPVGIGAEVVVIIWTFISVSVSSLVWSALRSFDFFRFRAFVRNHRLGIGLCRHDFNRLV